MVASSRKIPREKSVSLQDIANRCGVTKATVFHALQGNRKRVGNETRKRILVVAEELGYDAASQHAAHALSLQKYGRRDLNHVIAMFFPRHSLHHVYYWRMLQGIMDVLTQESFGLLADYDNSAQLCGRLLPAYARGEADGAIVLALPADFEPVLQQLRALRGFGKRPVISLIEPMEGCSLVGADDRLGARQAALHLLRLGHRRILRLAPRLESYETYRQRFLGHEDACAELGLDATSVFRSVTEWQQDKEHARMVIRRSLDMSPEITAILAPNDPGANWIFEVLHERGMKVPHDISLVGFDDTEQLLNDSRENTLTTVRVPLEEIGRQAATMMIDQVRGDNPSQKRLVLATELVVRTSAGAI